MAAGDLAVVVIACFLVAGAVRLALSKWLAADASPETPARRGTRDLTSEEAEATYEFIHAQVSERLDVLRNATDRVETKAVLVAGFDVTALTILLDRDGGSAEAWLLAAVTFLGLSLLATLAAVAIQKIQDPPSPQALVKRYANRPTIDVLAYAIGIKVEAHQTNNRRLESKASWWYTAVILLGLSIAAVFASVL